MKPTKDYGAIQRSHAAGILAQVFPSEWSTLTAEQQFLVAVDYLDAANDDNVGAREYARRIGTGNLASYGACMVARANGSRPWEGA